MYSLMDQVEKIIINISRDVSDDHCSQRSVPKWTTILTDLLLYLLVVTGSGFLDIFFFWSALEVASSIFELNKKSHIQGYWNFR